jgi:hypothetical protein
LTIVDEQAWIDDEVLWMPCAAAAVAAAWRLKLPVFEFRTRTMRDYLGSERLPVENQRRLEQFARLSELEELAGRLIASRDPPSAG